MDSRTPSDDIEVPPYFLCPISLEIMRDPVTVSTGITYDRQSIEKWLFSCSDDNTCPVTRQELASNIDRLTPNHTLRRLIQSWCIRGGSGGVIERFPTPNAPATQPQISMLLSRAGAAEQPSAMLKCLRSLRSIAAESDANKRCIESSGAVEFLASVVIDAHEKLRSDDDADGGIDDGGHEYMCRARDEAMAVLYHLKVSDSSLKTLLGTNGGESWNKYVDSLVTVLQQGSYDARAYAILLLKQVFRVVDPTQLARFGVGLLEETVQLLRDQVSQQASKAALELLVQLCSCGRNRVRAVEAGAVAVAVEILLENGADKRACEVAMVALEQLCGCAEGRAELVGHGAGLAVVSKKILRVSEVATERAVRVLLAVSRFSGSPGVVAEMAEVGVVAKLCLVMQVGCSSRTKEKAGEILRAHAKVWRHSPCVPTALLSW